MGLADGEVRQALFAMTPARSFETYLREELCINGLADATVPRPPGGAQRLEVAARQLNAFGRASVWAGSVVDDILGLFTPAVISKLATGAATWRATYARLMPEERAA